MEIHDKGIKSRCTLSSRPRGTRRGNGGEPRAPTARSADGRLRPGAWPARVTDALRSCYLLHRSYGPKILSKRECSYCTNFRYFFCFLAEVYGERQRQMGAWTKALPEFFKNPKALGCVLAEHQPVPRGPKRTALSGRRGPALRVPGARRRVGVLEQPCVSLSRTVARYTLSARPELGQTR